MNRAYMRFSGLPGSLQQNYVSPTRLTRLFAETARQEPDMVMAGNLIEEEFGEWMDADCGSENELKELADLVYVIYGYANVMGFNLDEAVKRVHKNNMGRMFQDDGTIKYREDGKVLKNLDFPKVDLGDLI